MVTSDLQEKGGPINEPTLLRKCAKIMSSFFSGNHKALEASKQLLFSLKRMEPWWQQTAKDSRMYIRTCFVLTYMCTHAQLSRVRSAIRICMFLYARWAAASQEICFGCCRPITLIYHIFYCTNYWIVCTRYFLFKHTDGQVNLIKLYFSNILSSISLCTVCLLIRETMTQK